MAYDMTKRRLKTLYRIATSDDYSLDFRYEAVRNMIRLREEERNRRMYIPDDVLRILYRVSVRRWWEKQQKKKRMVQR